MEISQKTVDSPIAESPLDRFRYRGSRNNGRLSSSPTSEFFIVGGRSLYIERDRRFTAKARRPTAPVVKEGDHRSNNHKTE